MYRIAWRSLLDGREHHDCVPFGTKDQVQRVCDYMNRRYADTTYHWPEAADVETTAIDEPNSPPNL